MDLDELEAARQEQSAVIEELTGEVTKLRRQVAAYAEHEASRVTELRATTARLQAALRDDTPVPVPVTPSQ